MLRSHGVRILNFSNLMFSHEKETLTRIPLAWPGLMKSSLDWDYQTV